MNDGQSVHAGRFPALPPTAPAVLRRSLYALAAGIALLSCAWTCSAIFSPRLVGSYTSVHAPVTASTDFIANIDTCRNTGVSGMLDDGSSFFFSDRCDDTTYQYAAGVLAPPRLINHAFNGLTDGLALDQGGYYGVAGLAQTAVVPGIYAFNPHTLALNRMIAPLPCHDTRGLAADPQTGTLYVTGDCGLARISDPAGPHPVSVLLAKADLDGVAVAADGQSLWVANVASSSVDELSPDGSLITAVPIPQRPVGVTVVDSATPSKMAGDVVVSAYDSSLIRVDVHERDTPSVLAAGGNLGGWSTIGPDGYLYVAKADRVEQLQPAVFGPITVPGPPPTAADGSAPATSHNGAPTSPDNSSTFTLTLLVTAGASAAAVLLAAVTSQRERSRQRRQGLDAQPAEVFFSPLEPAAPPKQPTTKPDYARLRRFVIKPRTRPRRLAWTPDVESAPCGALAGAPRDPAVARFDPLRRVLTDSQRLPSGTSLRFAVLVLTMIASTASIYAHLSVVAQAAADAAAKACLSHFPTNDVAPSYASGISGSHEFSCVKPYIPSLALWSAIGVVIAVTGSALVYAVTPWWIRTFSRPTIPFVRDHSRPGRRRWQVARPWWIPGKGQRLPELDRTNALKRDVAERLDALSACMNLNAKPTWLFHAYTSDARAFGHRDRTYVTVHNGLLRAFERKGRASFDAVALHELAHLRNRDNLPTYGTLAVWRVFLVATVLPYAVSLIAPAVISHPFDASAYRLDVSALDPRILVNSLILIALVFLASRSVMRAREAHADATAALYDNAGALRREIEAKGASDRTPRVLEPMSYHPGWRRRLADLDDPARLVLPGWFTMLAMGIAVALVMVNAGFTVVLGFPGFYDSFTRALLSRLNGPLVENELLLYGPSTLIVLTTIVAFACLTAWRSQLAETAAKARGGWTGTFGGALALVLGVTTGTLLSNVYADAGVWGVFDISVPWDLADIGASAVALAAITVLIFGWARESAAVWIPGARHRSLRAPLAVTVAVGVLGAAPALLVWVAAQNSSNITSFGNPAVPTLISSWFGAHWAYIDYFPLGYLTSLPGAGALFALPCLYLALGVAWRRRQARADDRATQVSPAPSDGEGAGRAEGEAPAAAADRWAPPRLSIKKIFRTGLAVAVVCELAGFAVAYTARTTLGGTALRIAFDTGKNVPYLPVAWMSWTAVTISAVTAPLLTHSLRSHRLTATLLTSFTAAGASTFLLLPPLFTTYCGTAAYTCAVEEPHDLLAAYGLLAAQTTVTSAAATALVLGLTMLTGRLTSRIRTHTPATAAGMPTPTRSHQPIQQTHPATASSRLSIRVIEWSLPVLVLANALAGIYAFLTIAGNF